MPVLHYRPAGPSPSVVVELPDRSVQCVPLSWTNRAAPDPHQAAALPGARLSGLALLELAERIGRWEDGR